MKRSIVTLSRLFSLAAALSVSTGAIRAEPSGNHGAASVLERSQVTGVWLGMRPLLSDRGIEIS